MSTIWPGTFPGNRSCRCCPTKIPGMNRNTTNWHSFFMDIRSPHSEFTDCRAALLTSLTQPCRGVFSAEDDQAVQHLVPFGGRHADPERASRYAPIIRELFAREINAVGIRMSESSPFE